MDANTNSPPNVHGKALAVNLDASSYGTFAEIGAGQEVARYFFTVGGASGTVSQTISAYDKTFSDLRYGGGTRYVSRERLLEMLEHEYKLLLERLSASRGTTTRFFVFADTASARNYKGDNEQHAWVGLRFQSKPGEEPSDVLLHVNLMDSTAQLQQQALGVLGVNLIYATFFQRDAQLGEFLSALWHELSMDRLEVDVIELRGPAFQSINARAACLQLIRGEMGRALVFDTSGQAVEPSSVLRKRPLVVERGLFDPIGPHHESLLRSAAKELQAEGLQPAHGPFEFLELSLVPVVGTPPNDAEVLSRVDHLKQIAPIIVSGFGESSRLADFLRRYTKEPIRFAMGIAHLASLLEERLYHHGEAGQLLEELGKLFTRNVKVYVYPMPRDVVLNALESSAEHFQISGTDGDLVTADNLLPRPPIQHLYRYLRESGWVIAVAPR